MTTILWVRHTEHELGPGVLAGRQPGIRLSDRGRGDARELAERLAPLPLKAIYTSPQQRTQGTALPLAERLGLNPRVLNDVDEVDFGSWTGLSLDELRGRSQWERWNRMRSESRAPGGETMLEVQARIAAAVETVRAECDGELLAIFSHGDVIRAAIALALGVHIDLFLRIEIGLGSVSAVRFTEGGTRVMCVNALSRESVLGF